MAASFQQLVFDIIASDRQASAAFDRFRSKVDQTSGSVDKNTAALDKNTKSLDESTRKHHSAIIALAGVGAAFAPITAGAAAAGAGVAAFGALAVPSVKKITTALTGPGGLSAGWVTLDNRQRNAALGAQALGKSYTGLARTLEPQVFQVFNQGLAEANSLLGPTGRLARTSGQGISDFLANFSADSGLQHFITFLSTQARPALDLLGQDVTHATHALAQLLESFAGPGMLELRALSAVFTGLDDSITFLSRDAPALTSVALGIGGIALALSKLGLLSRALKITGISNIASQMTGFVAATRDATVAEKGLLATNTALDAITPWGWAALGVAALGSLVFWLSKMKTVTDSSIGSIEAQHKAQGFNTAGYFAAAAAIKTVNAQQEKQTVTLTNLHTGVTGNTVAVGSLTGATADYTAAQQKLIAEGNNQNTFLETLQGKYGITRQAAVSLAEHSGVLASQVNKGGSAMRNAIAQSEAYANANLRAQRPTTQLAADLQDAANKTLTMTARTTALTNSLNLFFNPAVTADQALITLAGDAQTAAKAINAAGGKTELLTGKQGKARSAFDTYISQVGSAATSVFEATGKTSDYNRIIDANIPRLEKMAGKNKALRKEIQDLIDTEHKMKSENVAIHVSGSGSWAVVQGGHRLIGPGGGQQAGANGLLVTGGIPGQDSVPILAMPGEVVVPTRMVNAGAVDHLRGRLPGFADGGIVDHYSGALPGLNKWMKSENTATIHAMAAAVAAAFKAGMSSGGGFPGGGGVSGPGAAAAQAYARSVLGAYGWGQSQFPPLQALWNRESGWNYLATNPTSGAYGIPQSLPASKMAAAGADWRTNPATQIRWGLGYIRGRYGSPAGAWAHEESVGWYGDGLHATVSRPTLIGVGERGPEHVDVTPVAKARPGPLVQINGMVVREQADLAILAQKISFAVVASGLS